MAEREGQTTTVPETAQQYHKRMTDEMRRSDSIRTLQGQVGIVVLPTPPTDSITPSPTETPAPSPSPAINPQEHE